jgi:hypothetical protein
MFHPQSDIIFIFLEFTYLLFCLFYIFNPLPFIRWFGYSLAGFKFSMSALDSMDMENYRKVYEVVEGIGFEPVMNQEGAFTSLLYIAKITHIPLPLFHMTEIILFLYSLSFLFEYFVPKDTAITISLIFGLQSVPGEISVYLLRQLLSTSLIFIGIGFLLRKNNFLAFLFAAISCTVHSSSYIYFPLFLSNLFSKKIIKILVMVVGYTVFFIFAANLELGGQLIISTMGESSIYAGKHKEYEYYSTIKNWRNFTIGGFSLLLIGYFTAINIWKKAYFWKSPFWLYYSFTIIMTLFRIALERSQIFWLSSRFNFISSILLLSSSIILTFEIIIPEKEDKIFLALIASLLFGVSMIVILSNYDNNTLFRIPRIPY